MNSPDRKDQEGGLRRRLLAIVVTGCSLFVLLAGGFAYHLGYQRAVSQSHLTLTGLAEAVQKTLAIGSYANDTVLLREVIDGLLRNPLVASVSVHSQNGEVLIRHSSKRTSSAENRLLNETVKLELPLFSPFDAQEQMGSLIILADEGAIAAEARRESATFAGLLIGQAGLIFFLLYTVLSGLVTEPIKRLAQQLAKMQPGTSQRLETPRRHSHDEIGSLIDGANALLAANNQALQRERELRAEVQRMEAQYRQVFNSSSAGIFVLDGRERLINCNATASHIAGIPLSRTSELSSEDFIGRIFLHPERVRNMIQESAQTASTVADDLELIQRKGASHWVHCLISVHSGPGAEPGAPEIQSIEGFMYDITERKSAEAAVQYLADHDGLTGLKNRTASHAAIDRMLSEASAQGTTVCILCLDLDGFKLINDEYGHDAGDLVLSISAKRMKNVIRRGSDLVGRLGGDEFIVALRDVGPSSPALSSTLDNLLHSLTEPIELPNKQVVQVGSSIGIACMPIHGSKRENLLQKADACMYDVKRTGKNNYAIALKDAAGL